MEIVLYVLLGIIILLAIPFIIFDDFYLIPLVVFNRKNLRYWCLKKLKKNEQEIMMLGTLHEMHLRDLYYTFSHIKGVIDSVKPDLLLIETRQVEIDKGNLADGPIEMLFCHLYGLEKGIKVRGIDWWTMGESRPGTTNNKRDNNMTNLILKEAEGYKKVLLVVGASHLKPERKRLKKHGFKETKLSRTDMDTYFAHENKPFIFPKGMKQYMDIRIEHEKKLLENKELAEKWRTRTERIVEFYPNLKNYINEEE